MSLIFISLVQTTNLKKMKKYLFLIFALFSCAIINGQYADNYKEGFKFNFNEDGSKYIRLVTWAQAWAQYKESNTSGYYDISVRRARIMAYGQLNDRFLLLIHYGLNSLNQDGLSPTGTGEKSQFFLHDAWGEYKVTPYLYVGAGLHYWGGISRLNNASTLNIMTLDNDRSSWSTLGLSDQFGRHLGIYAKGQIKKFNYQIALNDSETNTAETSAYNAAILNPNANGSFYNGKKVFGSSADLNFAGYFEYQFLDKESNKLPFRTGTYLGGKNILNLGAGFFHHPDAIVKLTNGIASAESVTHLGVDVFYDAPIGNKNSAINIYGKYQHSDMGDNYVYGGDIIGTGNMYLLQVGYLLPSKTKTMKNRFMPYVSYNQRNFEGLDKAAKTLKTGLNFFLEGHNGKLTVEYQKDFHKPSNADDMVTVQAHIFL